MLMLRAVSLSDSKNLIATFCFCRDCFAAIIQVLPSDEEDTEVLLKF